MKIIKHLLILLSVTLLLVSCGIYSITGASIPPEAKTVSVQYFSNKAATVQATLSQVFTEQLKDMLVEQTNLINKINKNFGKTNKFKKKYHYYSKKGKNNFDSKKLANY